MKKSILILLFGMNVVGFSKEEIIFISNSSLGGHTVSITNLSVVATQSQNNLNYTTVQWNNSSTVSGQNYPGYFGVNTVLERSNQNNGYDTIPNISGGLYYSLNVPNTLFVDSTLVPNKPYHYRLTRSTDMINFYVAYSDTLYPQTVGIMDIEERENSVLCFPNPTTGLFHIESKEQIEQISLVDMGGKVVKSNIELSGAKLNKIDLTSFKNGVYFFRVALNNGKIVTKKVVKN